MTTWYSIEMVDAVEAKQTMQRIMDAFIPKYIGAGRPADMAIFSSFNEESNQITIYFSPKAISLAMQFGATSFDGQFSEQALKLLAGDEHCIDLLFPDVDTH